MDKAMTAEVRGKALTNGAFTVAIDLAHEQSHAISILAHRLTEYVDTHMDDLNIFADYAQGLIDFSTYRHRIETGEA